MPELGEAAEELRINSSRAAVVNAAEIPQELRKAIIDSCYSSLIRLGDLYRYFQTGLVSSPKRREWDRVATYYRLAGSIKPYKGASYHQLSIISLAKADHLEATYCLYRALCAMDPLPTADGNLQIELRKVLKEWNSGKLTENKSELELSIAHFMYLHAMCYKGVKFAEHDEAENKLLDKLAAEIARGSLESNLLQKLCLVNIAAEAHARTKPETNGNAPAFFHRLNVKTFSMLLRVFLSEEDSSTRSFHNILPALRIYSSWLVINSIYLTDESEDCLLDARIKELWELYASFLTRLSSTFDVQNIPYLNYLLPEDLDTLGFFPLMHNGKSRRHVDENGNAKSRAPEHNSEEDQKAEMQFRIRELVVDGLDLVDRKVSQSLSFGAFVPLTTPRKSQFSWSTSITGWSFGWGGMMNHYFQAVKALHVWAPHKTILYRNTRTIVQRQTGCQHLTK